MEKLEPEVVIQNRPRGNEGNLGLVIGARWDRWQKESADKDVILSGHMTWRQMVPRDLLLS